MSTTPNILVVDDDPAIRQLLTEYLSERELRVTGVPDGVAMRKVLNDSVIDLIVLDLKLPSEDGMSIARSLREQSSIPIIMLTGKGDDVDRIVGLELGADDYLTKPFNPRELLARIRTILRRTQAHTAPSAAGEKLRARRFAGWELDLRTRRLTSPAGQRVDLTHAEFGLLSALLGAPEHVLTRDRLLEMSHGFDDDVFDRSVDVQILRLRRKIETDPRRPQLIKTQRGAGYYLAAKVESIP
jgi:two-component system, OmpR family, response regulator